MVEISVWDFCLKCPLVHKIIKNDVLCKCEDIIPLNKDIYCHQRMSHFHLDTPVHVLNIKWGGLFIPVQAAHPVHKQISVFRWHWLADCPHEWMVSFKHIFGLMVLILKTQYASNEQQFRWWPLHQNISVEKRCFLGLGFSINIFFSLTLRPK